MTQDEIIRMAREAGLAEVVYGEENGYTTLETKFNPKKIADFAALVAAHEREKHVDLTNDEIANLFKSAYPQSSIMDCDISLGKRIIAAFKEKNK